ncbi:hypothetical protein BSNK01_30270 [Bacillaceae bacterium]
MKTSIIILTYNKLEYTKLCIDSIRQFTDPGSYEVIIIDNHSTDGTVEWLKQQSDLKVIFNKENVGFPKGCNQGIEVASGDNILLLNNDTVVTKNWLHNLLIGLYSSSDIGAVGPVTNAAAYYSTIPVQYKNLEEMHRFANQYNQSNPNLWEERLKLIGFCMLIKREAVEKVGLLDERFTPGNFEDDDYSIRLREAGYRLLLCKDTFIHHFGSISWRDNISTFSRLLTKNEQKFKEKWGTDSLSYQIHFDVIQQMEFPKDKGISVLHIGCQSGGTLLQIRNKYKNARLFGIETNEFEAREASRFARISSKYDIGSYGERQFDVIIFTDDEIEFNESLLQCISNHLKEEGIFIGKFLNISHYNIIKKLLTGENPFAGMNKHRYGLSDIEKLLKRYYFATQVISTRQSINQNDQNFIHSLNSLVGSDLSSLLATERFVIKAHLNYLPVVKLINSITECEKDRQQKLNILNEYDITEVITAVKLFYTNSVEVLQQLAIFNYSNMNHDYVLPYLQAAFELDRNNKDTLYNLAFVLHSYGETELSKRYLDMIEHKDEETMQLYDLIVSSEREKSQELVFLLRRLEFDIDVENTKKEIACKITEGCFEQARIFKVIETNCINKLKVLQTLAVICFENGLHEYVLPFLNKAYELDPFDHDTLYNLGYVLLSYGEDDLARTYLEKINDKDESVLELLQIAQGAAQNE